MTELQVFPNGSSVARAAADIIVECADAAIHDRERFAIGLSGGSTPRALFALLASDTYSTRFDWPRMHIFWGDERCVPPDHADSNYRMAHETWLKHVPIPAENIHRMHGELTPEITARSYEERLRAFFSGDAWPRFDLLLQGMGSDGHTASLFPGTTALHERERWVIENHVPSLETWRVTLTVPALNAAASIIFLVAGADKAPALRAVIHGKRDPETYPAQFIQPADGRLLWLVDTAAVQP